MLLFPVKHDFWDANTSTKSESELNKKRGVSSEAKMAKS